MKAMLEKIKSAALAELSDNGADLEQIRVRYLGKKGELTAVLRGMGQLSPEEFVECVNGIMKENGATISTSMGYRVETFSDDELTGSRARNLAEGYMRDFWPDGKTKMGLSYQGTNEDGNHVFYIHR